jgi:dihydroorotase-like cyclic amidohydrolase
MATVIKNGTVVLPDRLKKLDILIDVGHIAALQDERDSSTFIPMAQPALISRPATSMNKPVPSTSPEKPS